MVGALLEQHLRPLDITAKAPDDAPPDAKSDYLGVVVSKEGCIGVSEGEDSVTHPGHSGGSIHDIVVHDVHNLNAATLSEESRGLDLLETEDCHVNHLVSDADVAIGESLDALIRAAKHRDLHADSFDITYSGVNIVMPVPIGVPEHDGMVEVMADGSLATPPPMITIPRDPTPPASDASDTDWEHVLPLQETIHTEGIHLESGDFFTEMLTDSFLHDFTSLRGEAELIANEIIAARIAASDARRILQDAFTQAECVRAQSDSKVHAAQNTLGVIEQERERAVYERERAIRELREAEEDADCERRVASVVKDQANKARLDVLVANRELDKLQSEIIAARALLSDLRREVAESLQLNTMDNSDEGSRKDENSEKHDAIPCPSPTLFTYLKEGDIVANNYTWIFL